MVQKIFITGLFTLLLHSFYGCCKDNNPSNKAYDGKKIDGVSFVGSREPISKDAVLPLADINCDWATVMPLAFTQQADPDLKFELDWQWWGERTVGVIETCRLLEEQNIQYMIKPQIWMFDGGFTGNLLMNSEEDWLAFETKYETFILMYAEIAEANNAKLFCIGTEMKSFVLERPEFWDQLITKVRKVYSGELTYAGNWDSYKLVDLWSELDYIGVDAYFPLSEAQTPSVEEMKNNWKPWLDEISQVQQQYNIPVIFTEYGYRSVDYCAKEPWESAIDGPVNMQAQTNAYQAFFETFWEKEWFAGGFLWKWFDYHQSAGGLDNDKFTPQNKPVSSLIKEWYQ